MSTDSYPTQNATVADEKLVTEPSQIDYFGFGSHERFYFPDKVTFVEFSVMNEGEKSKFQRDTSKPLRINTKTSEAVATMDPAKDRHALLRACIKNWNLLRGGQPIPFSPRALSDFLELANPKLVEDIEFAIQKANPWMNGELTSEQLTEEINRLIEVRDQVEADERGEAGSASK